MGTGDVGVGDRHGLVRVAGCVEARKRQRRRPGSHRCRAGLGRSRTWPPTSIVAQERGSGRMSRARPPSPERGLGSRGGPGSGSARRTGPAAPPQRDPAPQKALRGSRGRVPARPHRNRGRLVEESRTLRRQLLAGRRPSCRGSRGVELRCSGRSARTGCSAERATTPPTEVWEGTGFRATWAIPRPCSATATLTTSGRSHDRIDICAFDDITAANFDDRMSISDTDDGAMAPIGDTSITLTRRARGSH